MLVNKVSRPPLLPLMMIVIACVSLYIYILIDDQAIVIMFTRRRDIILIELVA